MGWHLFEKSRLTLERQERVLEATEGDDESAAIRGALIKLFPDTIISKETRSAPDRKPGHVTDQKSNDRLTKKIESAAIVTRGRGVAQPRC